MLAVKEKSVFGVKAYRPETEVCGNIIDLGIAAQHGSFAIIKVGCFGIPEQRIVHRDLLLRLGCSRSHFPVII